MIISHVATVMRPLVGALGLLLFVSGCQWHRWHFEGPDPDDRTIALSESRAIGQAPRRTADLDRLAAEAAAQAIAEEGKGNVAPGEIYITVIDARDPRDPRMGSLRGAVSVYPASVIKMCYMVDAFMQAARGDLVLDGDFRRDLYLMIRFSDNKATNRVLDRLTNTRSGAELQGTAWDSFAHKRQTVARDMQALGLSGLWAVNKTFDDTIPLMGRDVQWLGPARDDHYERSNSMTTDDTARLLYMIWRRALVDATSCEQMLGLMKRDAKERTLLSEILPADSILYSKDGWTGLEVHDAGIIQLRPDEDEQAAIILVIFTLQRGIPEGEGSRPVNQRAGKIILDRLLGEPGVWGVGD